MKNMTLNTEILNFNKDLGVITNREVILSINNKQEKINFDFIKKVKLIKQRIYFKNLFLVLLSISLFITAYFLFKEFTLISTGFLILATYSFIFSFYHKYYKYKLVIIDKQESIHKIETKQSKRESIKEFYFTIAKKISKNKSELN